jgi:hypothetical protein
MFVNVTFEVFAAVKMSMFFYLFYLPSSSYGVTTQNNPIEKL